MRKIREILRLKYEAKLSHRAIARACSVGAGTVAEYLRRARVAGLAWPLPEELDDAALNTCLFPPTVGRLRVEPDMAHMHAELRRAGVTLQLLWLEYREANPEGYGYSHYCDLYRRWAKRLNPTMRQVHRAGQRGFMDFSGQRPVVTDPSTGEERPVELFVSALGASNLVYAEATLDQSLESWLDAHQSMLEYYGGSPAVWVPDNLKSAVTKACPYEPVVNRTYAELAEHYGAVVIPARTAKPRDKAKVEVSVQVVERWVLARLRNRRFFSLEELNAAIRELVDELNDRPMKHLGKSRRELFESIEREHLKPLPEGRYDRAYWKRAKVNIDYHIVLERSYYSVPYRLVHESVEVRYTSHLVEIFHGSKRVAIHRRLDVPGQCATTADHMPRSHRAHSQWTPSRLIDWAEKTGVATGRVVAAILESRPHPEQGYRSCLGLLRLGKRYGSGRLESACSRAWALKSPSYRTVKNILASGMDRVLVCEEPAINTETQRHENIRGAAYYGVIDAESGNHREDARDEDVSDG
jgi:transposase